MDGKKLIGIGGTNGSGKDTIGQILADYYDFYFISVSDLLRSALRAEGSEVTRQNLSQLSAKWRRESGLGVLVDKALEQFKKISDEYSGLVIASLRNPGEADKVHELGGKVIWLDADPKLRYQRITEANRGRDGEDSKTFKQFLAEEQAEMVQSGDAATLSGQDVKLKADYFLENNKDLAKLQSQVQDILAN
jgi:dephospho-CoA kinase